MGQWIPSELIIAKNVRKPSLDIVPISYEEEEEEDSGLTFEEVSKINAERAEKWHNGFPNHKDGWTGADWSNAMCGEAGETANVVKKLRRIETGLNQRNTKEDLLKDLANEIGDTYLYLDLLAQYYGLEIGSCIRNTFNRISEREGFEERL